MSNLSGKIDHKCTDAPICPHCGQACDTDDLGMDAGDEDGEVTCVHCDGEFHVVRRAWVTYSTDKVLKPPMFSTGDMVDVVQDDGKILRSNVMILNVEACGVAHVDDDDEDGQHTSAYRASDGWWAGDEDFWPWPRLRHHKKEPRK